MFHGMYRDLMMGKKVAIFTWCYDNGPMNYGQILQCYAMQKLCEKYNLDVTVIKYRHLRGFEKILEIPQKGMERNDYERSFKEQYVERQDTEQMKRFLGFISENIHLSPQCYLVKEIEEEIENKEILIVGSDQLWNPLWFDPVYLLEFAKTEQRRVSIATGGISVDKKAYNPILKRIAKAIEKFDYVSVREPVSKDILNCYTDKKIVDLLDPTLLLDDLQWRKLCEDRLIKDKYIFVYYLGKITPHKHILKEIAKKCDVKKIVYIRRHYFNENINEEGILEPFDDAGPKEFLALIRYAEAVCTDSFHGLVFSLVFKKDFYLMDRAYKDMDVASNTRAENLQNKLKFKKRFANSKKELSSIEKIDYEIVEKELHKIQEYCTKEFEYAIELM